MTIRSLLAKMEKNRPSFVSKETMYYVAQELNNLMMENLKEGYALELLGFGTLFITMKGKINQEDTQLQVSKHLDIGFKPSKQAKYALKQLQVKNILQVQKQHYILSIKEKLSKSESQLLPTNQIGQRSTITKIRKEHIIELRGKAINIKGSDSALYLAPLSNDEKYKADKSDWIKIDYFLENMPSKIHFYLNEKVQSGFYKIVIITKSSGSDNELKQSIQIDSDSFEVVERS